MEHHIDRLRRRLLLAPAAALCSRFASAAEPAVDARKLKNVELRISVYKGHNANFFEDAGVDDFPYKVTYSEFPPASNLLIEAVSSGAIDLAGSSNVSPVFVDASRARFRQVSSLRQNANVYNLIAPKGSKLRSVADLKGKTIAYLRATTPHYFFLKVLQAHGLKLSDVKAVPMMQQDGYAAFRSGQLDAWAVGGLFSTFAKRDGGVLLAKGGDYFAPRGATVTNLDALADPLKRAAIGDYFQREKKALLWMAANPQPWANKLEKLTRVGADVYLEQYNERTASESIGPVDDDAFHEQREVVKTFSAAGLLKSAIEVRSLWDTGFNGALST